MDFIYLLKGLAIGFSIAAPPVGPISLLCIRRTLAKGSLYGFVSGLGTATADATYGCIAGFGLTIISNFLVNQQTWVRLIGGAFLCYLGVKTFLAKPGEQATSVEEDSLAGAYFSMLFLTLTNPLTIISFAAFFASLGLAGRHGNFASASVLVLGVFIGSALWWLILSTGVGLFRDKFNARALRWVNRISGGVITMFGVVAMVSVVL